MHKKTFSPHITLDHSSPVPLHHQLAECIMRELRQNRITAGTVIPPMLTLASDLGLNRDTVRKAYAALEEADVIRRSDGGRILYVSEEFIKSCSVQSLTAVGMVLPSRMESLLRSPGNPALSVVSGIIDGASDLGFSAMVVPLPEADDELARLSGWLRTMISKLNGLIYLGEDSHHSHDKAFELLLAEKSLPQVFISGHRFREHLGIVSVDIVNAADTAVAHLYELGHRSFALCGSEIPVRKIFQLQTFDRLPVMAETIRRYSCKLSDERIITGQSGAPEMWKRLKKILSEPDRPTAIICSDDSIALKVIEAASAMKLKVPKDLSVIGYGDTAVNSNLTSIHHPWMETGRSAIDMIAESLRRNIAVNMLDRTLAAPLTVRGSTGKAQSKK